LSDAKKLIACLHRNPQLFRLFEKPDVQSSDPLLTMFTLLDRKLYAANMYKTRTINVPYSLV